MYQNNAWLQAFIANGTCVCTHAYKIVKKSRGTKDCVKPGLAHINIAKMHLCFNKQGLNSADTWNYHMHKHNLK